MTESHQTPVPPSQSTKERTMPLDGQERAILDTERLAAELENTKRLNLLEPRVNAMENTLKRGRGFMAGIRDMFGEGTPVVFGLGMLLLAGSTVLIVRHVVPTAEHAVALAAVTQPAAAQPLVPNSPVPPSAPTTALMPRQFCVPEGLHLVLAVPGAPGAEARNFIVPAGVCGRFMDGNAPPPQQAPAKPAGPADKGKGK